MYLYREGSVIAIYTVDLKPGSQKGTQDLEDALGRDDTLGDFTIDPAYSSFSEGM